MQQHQHELQEIVHGTYSPQSMSVLKVLWNTARVLPTVDAVHLDLQFANECIAKPLSNLDWSKPVVVDIGSGLGSFAAAYAQGCEEASGG